MHGHRDMENLVTYVREGALQHEIVPVVGRKIARNVQAITAGRGIRHSEGRMFTRA